VNTTVWSSTPRLAPTVLVLPVSVGPFLD